MATLSELQADLVIVNSAISKLIAGDRITIFEIGSGSSARRYEYGEVTLENLASERDRLAKEISLLTEEPVFRTSSVMQTVWGKMR